MFQTFRNYKISFLAKFPLARLLYMLVYKNVNYTASQSAIPIVIDGECLLELYRVQLTQLYMLPFLLAAASDLRIRTVT